MSNLSRYGIAVGSVALITLAEAVPGFPRHLELFLAAVAVSAFFGGSRAGLLALGLSLGVYLCFLAPEGASALHLVYRTLLLSLASALILAAVYVWRCGRVRTRELQSRETELRKAIAELRLSKEKAEMASQAKDRFLAALSHELRTPLTPVLLAAEGLEARSGLSEEAHKEIALIRHHVRLEARLIDDLLDFTRFEKGKIHLEHQQVDLHEVLAAAIDLVRDEATRRNIRIVFHPDAPNPHVNGDRTRIKQVALNLLNNSLKFTPAGGNITATTRNTGEKVAVSVADTGIGIEPEALGRLFNAFENIGADQHRFGGIGLGLAIARKVVELHGGEIHAESAGPGKGALFTFALPICEQPAEPAAACDSSHLRILLVEDHEPTAFILSRLLKRHGHAVRMAANRHEAFSLAGFPIDLLVSDIGLPDGSGIDVVRHYREVQKNFKAIALSGYGMETDVKRSLAAGFDRHVTKPIDFEALRHAIGELFRLESH